MIRRVLVRLLFCFVIFTVCSCSSREADAEAHLELAREHAESSHYHDALREFDKTIRLVNEGGNKRHDLLMMSYNGMGSISFIFGDTLASIIWYKRAWNESNAVNNNDYKARICSNLAIAYNSAGATDSAFFYNSKLRGLLDKGIGVPYHQFYFNQGRIEYKSGNDSAAIAALDSAISDLNKSGDKHANSEIFILTAKAYLRLGNMEKSAEYAKLGDVNVEFETNDNNRLRAYRDLAYLFSQIGDTLKAEAYNDHAESLKRTILNGNQALKISRSDGGAPQQWLLPVVVSAILLAASAVLYFFRRKRNRKHSEAVSLTADEEQQQPDSGILARIDEALRRNKEFCQPDFDISMLSRLTGINQKYVSRAINASGVNFRTFIARHRVEEAIRLMTNPDIMQQFTIETIGKKVGFRSHSNFIAAFKKIKGETPSAFLRRQPDRS